MSSERFQGREEIFQGMENSVLKPKLADSDVILKVSRLFNYLSMLGVDQGELLRQELRESQALIEGTDLKIPRTRIHSTVEKNLLGVKTKGYVIGQEYIQEDGTVEDVGSSLASQGLDTLVDEYEHEPRNFISRKGVVYWVDPTKGTAGRVLENMGIMKLETYRKLRRRLSKIIRFFGL